MSHIHEKIDFTVDVFVVHKNRVLLRMHDKYNLWLTPGGHIELDEDPVEAALREIKEETGLVVKLWDKNLGPIQNDERVKVLLPPILMNRHNTSDTHEHISLVYLATTENPEIKPAEGEKQDGCKWFTREELDSTDMPPNIRAYAKFALDTIHD